MKNREKIIAILLIGVIIGISMISFLLIQSFGGVHTVEDFPAQYISGPLPEDKLLAWNEPLNTDKIYQEKGKFICRETGKEAEKVEFYRHSPGPGVIGGWSYRYALVCGNYYWILDAADHFGTKIYGPFKFTRVKTNIIRTCSSNADCDWVSTNCCPETAGAHWECINARLSEIECPKDIQCPEVLSGRPRKRCVCENGICTAEGTKPRVWIRTDKEEYEQGETVKLTAYVKGKAYAHGASNVTIFKKYNDKWIAVRDYSLCIAECGWHKFCEDYFLVMCSPAILPCRELEDGTLRVWEQKQALTFYARPPICEWRAEPSGKPKCKIELNVGPGKYKFKLYYWPDENCFGKSYETESNEFIIKPSQAIAKVCGKEKESMENIQKRPECREKEFWCVDGWEESYYYDSRLADETKIPSQSDFSLPDELKNAVVAIYNENMCSCVEPISYSVLSSQGLTKTDCESFYTFIEDYNKACGGCLKEWYTSCC